MLNTSSSEDDYDEDPLRPSQKCLWVGADLSSVKNVHDFKAIDQIDTENASVLSKLESTKSGVSELPSEIHGLYHPSTGQFDKHFFKQSSSRINKDTSSLKNIYENASLSSHISSQSHKVEGERDMVVERTSPFDSCWSSDHQNSCDLESLRSESTASVKQEPFSKQITSKVIKNSLQAGVNSYYSQTYQQQAPNAHNLRYSTSSGLGSGPNTTPKIKPAKDNEEINAVNHMHRNRLQIYIFTIRCIAYPFSIRPSEEPIRRYLKITKEHLSIIIERFQNFIQGKMSIVCDEEFFQAIESFYSTFLKSDRVSNMVKSGGCSLHDFREVFINFVKGKYEKSNDEEFLDSLIKVVIPSWKVKFDQICRGGEGPSPEITKLAVPQAELINPSAEQLYEMFMKVLSIKKYEHQILFNACQLDNIDEQATQIRREISHCIDKLKNMNKNKTFPKLVHKEMESQYFDEEMSRKNDLMYRLDALPVNSGSRLLSHGLHLSGGNQSSLISAHHAPGISSNVVQQIQRKLTKHCPGILNSAKSSSIQNLNLFGSPSKADRMSLHSYPAFPNRPLFRSAVGSPKLNNNNTTTTTTGIRYHNKERSSIISLSEDACIDPTILAGLASSIAKNSSTYSISSNNKLSIEVPIRIEVFVNRLKSIPSLAGKLLFVQIELEGSGEKQRTESLAGDEPHWDTVAEFHTKYPLVGLRIKLYREASSALSMEDKEIGKMTIYPTKQYNTRPHQAYHKMMTQKNFQEPVELQLTVSVEWPSNIKYCGFCWVKGKKFYKNWKFRYLCLVQVSQYKFVLAHFKHKKSTWSTFMPLDGFTVDFCPPQEDLIQQTRQMSKSERRNNLISNYNSIKFWEIFPEFIFDSNLYFCNLVREGETAHVATYDINELNSWIQAIYRATGQSHKPSFPIKQTGSIRSKRGAKSNDGSEKSNFLESLTLVQPDSLDQHECFRELQRATLDYRLNDPFVSLGWFSPSQCLVLDEYSARYGVREFQRYLYLLEDLLDKAEHSVAIDPDLIHYSYSLCVNYAMGKSHHDQKVHTILASEKVQFKAIKTRLLSLLERQITEFRYCFPFGRPEGALEKMLGLLELVLTKDNGEPASADVVRSMIQSCLRNAAILNYERISEYALIEVSNDFATRSIVCENIFYRLEENIHLGELCIEVLQQNQLHYSDAFSWFYDLFVEHAENFWALYQIEIDQTLSMLPKDTWEAFHLFQVLNNYLIKNEQFTRGNFHTYLIEKFEPMIDRYLRVMEKSINEALVKGIEIEDWSPTVDTGAEDKGVCEEVQLNQNRTSQVHNSLDLAPHQQQTSNRIQELQKESAKSEKSTDVQDSKALSAMVFTESAVNMMNMLSTSSTPFCCLSVLDLINRLRQLKAFVKDLNWPIEHSAKILEERVSLMCARLLKESAKLTLIYLEMSMRQSAKNTNLVISKQCCTMVNTLIEIRSKLYSLCKSEMSNVTTASPQQSTQQVNNTEQSGSKRSATTNQVLSSDRESLSTVPTETDASSRVIVTHLNSPINSKQMHRETEDFIDIIQRKFIVIICEQLVMVLHHVLTRLTRYDEDNMMSSLLGLTKPKNEDGRMYVNFVHANLQQISKCICDELYVIALFEKWYTLQMRMIYEWLVHRKHILLHSYQVKCLETIVKKVYSDFQLQGLSSQTLDTVTYQTILSRIQAEETTISVKQSTDSMSIFSGKINKAPGFFTNPFNR